MKEHYDPEVNLLHVMCAGGVTDYCSKTYGMLTKSRTEML